MKRTLPIVVAAAVLSAGCATTAPPPKRETSEPPVERYKRFECVDSPDTSLRNIARVGGTAGDSIAIRPTGQPCDFELVYRSASGVDVRLGGSGGYLLAAGKLFVDGTALVCASNVAHDIDPDAPQSSRRIIESVAIECTSYDGTRWAPLRAVAGGGTEWAAWVASIGGDSAIGHYRLRYTRDFSFQVLNTGDRGRPDTDGTYDAFFTWGSGGLEVASTQMVADQVTPAGAFRGREWTPNDEQIASYAGVFPSPGRCAAPSGCPTP